MNGYTLVTYLLQYELGVARWSEWCAAQFSIKGYNDKQHILLRKLVDRMMALDIDEKRFDILLERVSC